MPSLPTDGIFAVDDLLKKVGGAGELTAKWFWKDDGNNWVAYTNAEAGIIEVNTLFFCTSDIPCVEYFSS